jgi:hypothetical protein
VIVLAFSALGGHWREDHSYVVKFRTADGDVLAISIARNETAVIKHFQERMPYGRFVPDDASAIPWPSQVPKQPA